MGRDYRQPRKFDLWSLASNSEEGIRIQKAAADRAELAQMLVRIQEGVQPRPGQRLALKYSCVLGPVPAGGNVLLLGWDHAAHLQRDPFSGRYFLQAVYSHTYSETSPDTHAYRLDPMKGMGKPLCDSTAPMSLPKDKHACGTHPGADCVWQKYALPPLDSSHRVWIREVVTVGVSSCSFVTLWDESRDHLFVAHLDARPIIPLAWLAVEELKPRERAWMRMLASVNPETEELEKFTTSGRIPYADRLAIDSLLLLRGPEGEAAYMGHPDIGLDVSRPREVVFQGIIGSSAGSGLPPFHSLFGELIKVFAQSQSAADILGAMTRLVQGDFGFADLYRKVMDQLVIALHAGTLQKRASHSSTRLKHLRGQLSGGLFSKAVPVPETLGRFWPQGGTEAAFLFAELVKNPQSVPDWARQAVLDGWTESQRRFELHLEHHAQWENKS